MSFLRELKNKGWIDWIKLLVAVDIAFAGFALIINLRYHVLADMFGFLTRIPFGLMYIFVAVLIFKRIFPKKEHIENVDKDIHESLAEGKRGGMKIIEKLEKKSEEILHEVDHKIDQAEDFLKNKKKEAEAEIKRLLDAE